MLSSEAFGKLKPWLEYYPDEDEEGFDGVHYGGVRGLKKDAPADMCNLYNDIVKSEKDGLKVF